MSSASRAPLASAAPHRNRLVVGLMSGTSMDGVDAALLLTDGGTQIEPVAFHCRPYAEPERAVLRAAIAEAAGLAGRRPTPAIAAAARLVTDAHAQAVAELLALAPDARPELVGFHGQTIAHRPDLGWTWQIGDGAALARALALPVVFDFRAADMAAGGQGAPLLPVFHRALVAQARAGDAPVAILNLGGVANITWLGAHPGAWLSFDTGPANALIDDWVRRHYGRAWDEGGALAASGRVDAAALARLLDHPFFAAPPPKSLDRNAFAPAPVAHLAPADGAATLTAFTAEAVARAFAHLPAPPAQLLVTGGGRHNRTMLRMLAERLPCPVDPVEAVGWDGDALEAQAFGYFAVRHVTGRPITFPETTGCAAPTVGGVLAQP
jgi:anhydro-N-acetylmuramic acid kinase